MEYISSKYKEIAERELPESEVLVEDLIRALYAREHLMVDIAKRDTECKKSTTEKRVEEIERASTLAIGFLEKIKNNDPEKVLTIHTREQAASFIQLMHQILPSTVSDDDQLKVLELIIDQWAEREGSRMINGLQREEFTALHTKVREEVLRNAENDPYVELFPRNIGDLLHETWEETAEYMKKTPKRNQHPKKPLIPMT